MYQKILMDAFAQIPVRSLETELLVVFKHDRVSPHLNVLKFASTKHTLLHNYSQALQVASKNERVSGFFRGSLGTMLSAAITKPEAAQVVGVSTRSITRAMADIRKKQADSAVSGKHNKFVSKTNYKVSRLPVAPSMVTNWILDHCRASANSANVVRQREANGAWGFQIRHYRDSSINDLFNEYKVRLVCL